MSDRVCFTWRRSSCAIFTRSHPHCSDTPIVQTGVQVRAPGEGPGEVVLSSTWQDQVHPGPVQFITGLTFTFIFTPKPRRMSSDAGRRPEHLEGRQGVKAKKWKGRHPVGYRVTTREPSWRSNRNAECHYSHHHVVSRPFRCLTENTLLHATENDPENFLKWNNNTADIY